MSTHVGGRDIGDAWLAAYSALTEPRELVNLTVAISEPTLEDLGVRNVIEQRVAELRTTTPGFGSAQTIHTVANTIFPISLYRPGQEGAAERFFRNVERNEAFRKKSRTNRWGTYIGRLVAYPGRDGVTTNQLRHALETLRGGTNYKNRYEMPIISPGEDLAVRGASTVLQGDARNDNFARGGPCLVHVSMTSFAGRLSMVALYRNHVYEQRAYGNFLGLARLLTFMANESGREVGELLVVANHALAEAPSRRALRDAAAEAQGIVTPIEYSARPLGSPSGHVAA